MNQPAVGDENQQAVVNEDNNTPTPQPAVDPKPVVDTSENGETTNSDTENGVANLPLLDENRPVVDNSSTTEEEPTVDVGDVLYDLYDFNGRQTGGDVGYVWNTYTVTYDANLPEGASFINSVSLPEDQTVSDWDKHIWVSDLTGRNDKDRVAQVSGKNEYYKFLGWATTSTADKAQYTPNNRLYVSKNTTLYAVWERNDKDVMYFVLMPGIDAPSDGADQGYQKYYPNKTDENDQKGDDGGVSGCTVYTGYTGGNLTETGFNAVPTEGDSVVDLAGQYSNSTYLSVPSDLGYFNANTKTDKLNLDMTGKEIVWYVIKNQADGYHVDGYVKNVPIEVRYHENFNGDTAVKDTVTDIVSGETVTVKTEKAVFGEDYTHEGYTFAGWSTSQGEGGTLYQPGDRTEQLVTSLDLYAKWVKDDSSKKTLKYTVEYYKDNEKVISDTRIVTEKVWVNAPDTLTVNKAELAPADKYTGCKLEKTDPATIPDTINHNGVIKVYYTKTENPPAEAQYTVKHYKWDTQEKKYTLANTDVIDSTVGTYVTAKAKAYDGGYILNEQKSAQTMSGTVLKDNTLTLDLYYDIDKIGSGNNKDKPDGTPDRYQVTINYVSSNTNWGSVNRSKEVITLINTESGEWLETGTVIAPSCTATSAGGKCYFVNWTKKQEGTTDVSTVDSTANLPEQTIENAKGGDVYTFTANFDRSSGGGSGGSNRPKPPVVEIPDDVPTGLNGKDHYAYIIGYGNNDVRPQNNITRAEVATIFFRLLTDETREANMTKSNSYNDVKDGDWFCCAVSTLSKMGIIKGYEDGSFKPNDPISRAEFAAIAARFDPDGDKTPATFADVTSHWAKDEISIAANHGWIKGYEDGSFKPDQKITRAETMTLVNRVLNRLPETKDDLHKDMKTWVDNMDETAWYYLAVQEATNSHYFKNKTSTKFEQWTDLRDTRDWSELEK